jgi:DNA recombination protein RmuC
MTDALFAVAVVLLLINLALLLVLLRRRVAPDTTALQPRLDALEKGQERTERAVREEIARGRDEGGLQARQLREELSAAQVRVGDSLLQNLGTLTRSQQAQFESLVDALGRMAEASHGSAGKLREEVGTCIRGLNETVLQGMGELSTVQKGQLEAFSAQLSRLTHSNEAKLEALRAAVEQKLEHIRGDNARQLEQMRATVDEKLQGALEQRLGESFRLVSERLEQVHQGLGEMQSLASGVGDLKRVLSNVKVRGTWGEVQLAGLLEQVLVREQYGVNVETREGSGERVEFAVKLPGRSDAGDTVWLPIDAKFPQEDYLLLCEAQERGDLAAVEAAAKKLEHRLRTCARDICDKYLNPPATTDFGIMFLPTEGLYAEAIRRVGLIEWVQRECRVVIAGPTTLAALLNSLQMGFRTLAIERRSSEVWAVLGAVKTEFGRFGGVLDKVKKKLQEASNVVDSAQVRTRAMNRKLRGVEELPLPDAEVLLLGQPAATTAPDEEEGERVALVEA